MELLSGFFDIVFHIDQYLAGLANDHGLWIYAILFFIIFAETGFVIVPFLPGDSLLFAVGALAGLGTLKLFWCLAILILAAFLGNYVNYYIGKYFGTYLTERFPRLINPKNVDNAHRFYEKHGVTAIIISRFLPFIRTFVPFVAGIAQMEIKWFVFWTAMSAWIWVLPVILVGYFFGSLPIVQEHFPIVVLIIIALSLVPTLWTIIKARLRGGKEESNGQTK